MIMIGRLKMKTKTIFVLLFILVLAILNISIGLYIARFNSINFIYFLILELINIGIAYRFVEFFLSVIIKNNDLSKVEKLASYPPVALLYVTYNDAIPGLMSLLKNQSYKNYDIFILDDSTDEEHIRSIDASGLKILRRNHRNGFKAGSLNNWLYLYGDIYKYFIIADSDSVFGKDFIENMVKYAEHSSNENVAIFQSKILPWNVKNPFSRAVSAMTPLAMYFGEKLGNECDTIISWGHNNLHRTEIIRSIGGFDENFVAEDYATGLKAIKRGYECKIVNVTSFDAVPETIQSYTKRYIRWAKQTLQLLQIDTTGIPFYTRLHLFMAVYTYAVWIIYFAGTFIAVWGFSSSLNEFSRFIAGVPQKQSLLLFFILFLYILNYLFLRLPLAMRLGVSLVEYYKSLFLNISIHGYIMYPLIKAELETIFGGKIQFDVTEKTTHNNYEHKMTFVHIIKEMSVCILANILLLVGLTKNPIFLIFNFMWLAPLLMSPIVIYFIQRNATPKRAI